MSRLWIFIAALSGGAGAFADAGARHLLTDPDAIELALIAARYGLWHALALLAVAMLWSRSAGFWLGISGWCFTIGQLLFCGSLYLLALGKLPVSGLVTKPGLAVLLAGWAALALYALLPRRDE